MRSHRSALTPKLCSASSASCSSPRSDPTKPIPANVDPRTLSEAQWKARLTPEQYRILRAKGTERAFTGKYYDTQTPGVYKCAACGAILFKSDDKFDSHCGWPSFDKIIAAGAVEEHTDTSLGMVRTEVTCKRCGSHLGHVFDDGPTATGMRFCINSASIELAPKSEDADKGADQVAKPAQQPKK